ncbi:hypothetical protein Tco_0302705 [Tanacetum coccineum]
MIQDGKLLFRCRETKRLQDETTQGTMLLYARVGGGAQESGAVLVLEERCCFLAGEQVTNVDDDVDDSQENDLALNVDQYFDADEYDAFD